MEKRNFILKGQICYSKSPDVLETISGGYLVCKEGKSKGVFTEIPKKYDELPIFDYKNQLIIPGLVDLHVHAPQYGFRAMGMDMELLDWLDKVTFPEEAKYSDEKYAKAGYEIFAKDMRNSATTRACIFGTMHIDATSVLMDLMEKTGLKTMVGKVNMNRNSPDSLREESAKKAISDTKKWIEKSVDKYENVKPILTPRFIPSCDDELMKGICDIKEEYHLNIQSHLSENVSETAWVKELCPKAKSYSDAYDAFGVYNEYGKAVMAHCVYLNDEEMKVIKDKGVFIAHCPQSNMNLASGIAPLRTFLDMGLKVGLGSDVAAGSTINMFRSIADAIQVSKLYWRLIDQSKKPILTREAFYMATKGGGEYFGKVGSFENEYEFDALVINDEEFKSPREFSLLERLERLIYLADDRNITAKYVEGRLLWELEAI
ncbi:MAG: amidohydrolase family protein [Suipraeoptans sp.]